MLINNKPASRLLKKPASHLTQKPACRKKPSARLPPAKRPKKKNLKAIGLEALAWDTNFSHENGCKRVTYQILRAFKNVMKGKPRGFDEIRATVQSDVQKGHTWCLMVGLPGGKSRSFWSSICSPPKHERHFRDPRTGFHTNNAESENSRVKTWTRQRYGKLHLNEIEMDEYIFYVDAGSSASKSVSGTRHGKWRCE